jgi:hypothetical protein
VGGRPTFLVGSGRQLRSIADSKLLIKNAPYCWGHSKTSVVAAGNEKSRIDFREISRFQQNSLFRLLGIHDFFSKIA